MTHGETPSGLIPLTGRRRYLSSRISARLRTRVCEKGDDGSAKTGANRFGMIHSWEVRGASAQNRSVRQSGAVWIGRRTASWLY